MFPLPRPAKAPRERARVYLAGAIENAPDGGVEWRRDLARFLENDLRHEVLDPTVHECHRLTDEERRFFRHWKADPATWTRFQQVVRRIIHRDAELILQETDYIIAYWDEGVLGGGGTHGELTLAFLHGIPVYLVLGLPRTQVSSWILGCCEEVFDSFEALKSRLRTLQMEGRLGPESPESGIGTRPESPPHPTPPREAR